MLRPWGFLLYGPYIPSLRTAMGNVVFGASGVLLGATDVDGVLAVLVAGVE